MAFPTKENGFLWYSCFRAGKIKMKALDISYPSLIKVMLQK